MSSNRLLTLVLAISLSAGAAGCGGDDDSDLPDGAAAKVGDTVISEAAVRSRLQTTYAAFHGTLKSTSFGPPGFDDCVAVKQFGERDESEQRLRAKCRAEYRAARIQAVSFLVNAQWLQKEAQSRRLDTSDQASQLTKQIRAHSLRGQGRGITRIVRIEARASAQTMQLQATESASKQEIKAYGDAHPETYHDSETRTLQVIQTTNRQRALAALAALKQGGGWERVRNRYGAQPTAYVGVQTLKEAAAPKDAFGAAVFASKPRQLSKPVKTPTGWFVFEVRAVRAPAPGLSPEAQGSAAAVVRGRKLAARLAKHYGDETICAERYRVATAPQCR